MDLLVLLGFIFAIAVAGFVLSAAILTWASIELRKLWRGR